MTIADRIWNRGCEGGGDNPRAGDLALSAMIELDGLIQNGGLEHAIEYFTAAELEVRLEAFDGFQMHQLAQLIRRAIERFEHFDSEEFDKMDEEYYRKEHELDMFEAFKRVFEQRPEQFAPLDEADMRHL